MTMIISSLVISKEIIKPSSPTPSNLKTHNLSWFDQFAPDAYMPMVIFYQNSNIYSNSHSKIMDMKNSLSQTLTQYYPFAGKLAKITPSFIDCNDDGVEFLEARNDKLLVDFLQNTQHEDLDQLFPYGQLWNKLHQTCHNFENDKASPLAIQINHFACGGLGVAVSLSHKIADGSSLCNFFNDWAIMTRLNSRKKKYIKSPIDPIFLSFKSMNLNFQGTSIDKALDNCVTRSFVFPGKKLNDLKRKVIAMTMESKQPITNPTRVEVLNWLLYKCALEASTKNNLGSFKPSGFSLVTNMRNKMIEPLPETVIGNFFSLPSFPTRNENEITPSSFINQVKKLKKEVQGIRNITTAVEILRDTCLETVIKKEQSIVDDYYLSTSLCRFPLYEIDFGWGKPIKVTLAGELMSNCFLALDARDADGVEVFVSLAEQDMEIFQRDPELLSFC